MVPQLAQRPFKLSDGYTAPKGSLIIPSITAACQQGYEQPDVFDPERCGAQGGGRGRPGASRLPAMLLAGRAAGGLPVLRRGCAGALSTQHNATQHNATQRNTTQHNTTQHNTTQHKNQHRRHCHHPAGLAPSGGRT
jgi:hypothetical protein